MDVPTGPITFSLRSQKAIEEIRQLKTMERLATGAFAIGSIAGIFGRAPLTSAFNITTTDWENLFKASQVLPQLFNRPVCMKALQLGYDSGLPNPERRFWKSISEAACQTR